MGINAYKITGYAFTDLIGFWEAKYGTINLDSCYINTQLRDKYKCSTYKVHDKKKFMKEISLLKRNQLIVDNIKKRDDKKIVIIYGKKHFKGIKNLLNN